MYTLTNCPHCAGKHLVAKTDNAGQPIFNYNHANSKFSIPLTCTSCGWAGYEVYHTQYLTFGTDHHGVPALVPTACMYEVTSNTIYKIGYDHELEHLFIIFRGNDKVYGYTDVNGAVYIAFLNAECKGMFYNEDIKGQYSRL